MYKVSTNSASKQQDLTNSGFFGTFLFSLFFCWREKWRVYSTSAKMANVNFGYQNVLMEFFASLLKKEVYEFHNTLSIVVLSELYILMGRGGEGKKF